MPSVEEWKPAPRWEGFYEVSNLGRIRTVQRKMVRSNGIPQTIRSRIRQPSPLKSGHYSLYLRHRERKEFHYVHRLVVEAFLGPIPDGKEVRHLNGKPEDNRLENLAIGTRSEQRFDDVRNGVHWAANKVVCKRGHLLEGANLVARRFKEDGHRICLPCNWATMRKSRNKWGEGEVDAAADFYASRLAEHGAGWTPSCG